MSPIEFTTVIEASGSGGAFITIPFDVETTFGAKRVPVRATFDGAPYRGTLVRMGGPQHILIVRRDIREKIGRAPGDAVTVTLVRDTDERMVATPPDLAAALAREPDAAAFFEQLSFTHRREYVQWIEQAKREETRRRRIEKAVEMLRARKKER